jgi:hypothetical protein
MKAQLDQARLEFDREKAQMQAQIESMRADLQRYDIDTKDRREREIAAAKFQREDRRDALQAVTAMNRPAPQGRPV